MVTLIEGFPTLKVDNGKCINMQAFTKMTQDITVASEGYTVTDYFHQQSCLPTWVVIEENTYHVQDEKFEVQSTPICPNKIEKK